MLAFYHGLIAFVTSNIGSGSCATCIPRETVNFASQIQAAVSEIRHTAASEQPVPANSLAKNAGQDSKLRVSSNVDHRNISRGAQGQAVHRAGTFFRCAQPTLFCRPKRSLWKSIASCAPESLSVFFYLQMTMSPSSAARRKRWLKYKGATFSIPYCRTQPRQRRS